MFEGYRKEQEERHNWNEEKDIRALNEEHEYSYERNPGYMKDPLMKDPEYRKSIEDERQYLESLKETYKTYKNASEPALTEEKGPVLKLTKNGSSIIITILVTTVVATAGILTAILMLK